MSRLKALRELKSELAAKIRSFADKANTVLEDGRPAGLTDDEERQYQQANRDYDQTVKLIEIQLRADDLEKDQADRIEADARAPETFRALNPTTPRDAVITDNDRLLALRGWIANDKATDKQVEAMQKCGLRVGKELDLKVTNEGGEGLSAGELQAKWRSGSAEDRAAMLAGRLAAPKIGAVVNLSGSAGFIPPGSIQLAIVAAMLAYGGVRQVAEIYETDSGETFKIPTANDTGNTGEIVNESATIGSTVDPTISSISLGAFKFSSKLIQFTYEMLRDSAFDLPGFLQSLVGERLGRITNTKFTTGAGTTEPYGFITGAATGKTTASGTAITFDEIIDLIHSVDPSYRSTGCTFMMHDNVAAYLRKLKAGGASGEYLWQDLNNYGMSQPFSSFIRGFPVVINQDMASTLATTNKTVAFGNFKYYKIRSVRGLRLRRLSELYAANDQEAIIAFKAEDARLANPGVNPIKLLAQL